MYCKTEVKPRTKKRLFLQTPQKMTSMYMPHLTQTQRNFSKQRSDDQLCPIINVPLTPCHFRTTSFQSTRSSFKNEQEQPKSPLRHLSEYDQIFKNKVRVFRSHTKGIDNRLNILYSENFEQFKIRLIKINKKDALKDKGDVRKKVGIVKEKISFIKNIIDYAYPNIVLSTIYTMKVKPKKFIHNGLPYKVDEYKMKQKQKDFDKYMVQDLKVEKLTL